MKQKKRKWDKTYSWDSRHEREEKWFKMVDFCNIFAFYAKK